MTHASFSLLHQVIRLSPTLKGIKSKEGIALDGRIRGADTELASSTLLADENSKDIFGMVISYTVKVILLVLCPRTKYSTYIA